MTNESKSKPVLEQQLLDSARVLAEHQMQQLNAIDALPDATNKHQKTVDEIKRIENQLVELEMDISKRKFLLLEEDRTFKKIEVEGSEIDQKLRDAQRHLWSIASSANSSEILEAATEYGKICSNHHTCTESRVASIERIKTIHNELNDLDTWRIKLLSALGSAKLQKQRASADLWSLRDLIYQDKKTKDLEQLMVSLAQLWAGEQNINVPCTFVETKDLAISRTGF